MPVAISRVLAGRFRGAKGQSAELLAPAGVHASQVLLIGAGAKDAFDAQGAAPLDEASRGLAN